MMEIPKRGLHFCAGPLHTRGPVFRQNAQLHNFFRNFFVYFSQIHFPEYRMYIYTLKMYKYTSLSPVYKYTSRVYIYTFLFFQKYFQKPIDKTVIAWYNNAVNPKTAGVCKIESDSLPRKTSKTNVQNPVRVVCGLYRRIKAFLFSRIYMTDYLNDYNSSVF